MSRRSLLLAVALAALVPTVAGDEPAMPRFDQYDPPSTLVVPEHPVSRARYPFVDVHNHQWEMPTQDLGELVAAMDRLNMAVMVNLSGRSYRLVDEPGGRKRFAMRGPDFLLASLEAIRTKAPGRFVVFTNLDFEGFGDDGWTARAVAQLAADVAAGAVGLKVYKNLGFDVRDASGKRVAVDDPRLDPIWAKCGELGVPVLIHTGEPASFWQPVDERNERLLELIEKPERRRDPAETTFEGLLAEQHAVFRRHPRTTFVDAHLGWLGHDLGRLGRLLDELPNVHTEIGAVLAELGRQPRFARDFFIRYQDRVLFGKDTWTESEYATYFRVLETADESFPYYRRRHAFWRMYGLELPDEVLRKLYYRNALRLLPGLDRRLFPATE